MSSLLADLTPGCLWALSPAVPWLPTAITVLAVPADVPWLPTLVACPSVCSRLLSPLCLPPFLRYHDSRPSWSAASLRGPWQVSFIFPLGELYLLCQIKHFIQARLCSHLVHPHPQSSSQRLVQTPQEFADEEAAVCGPHVLCHID
ncbi:unnamed protein product [Closterium sp. NIES-53]